MASSRATVIVGPKFLVQSKQRSLNGRILGKDKVTTQDQLKIAEEITSESDSKLGELNKLAFIDFFAPLSINHIPSAENISITLIENCKNDGIPD